MIIGINGKISSGKDTVGKIINFLLTGGYNQYDSIEGFLEYYNDAQNEDGTWMYPYDIKKFADKLKDAVCLLTGCTREQLEDADFKNQEIGEDWNCWEVNHDEDNVESPLLFTDIEEARKAVRILTNGSLQERRLTYRLLLQLLGTECGRQIIHPNIWVNALFARYDFETIQVAFHEGDYMGKCQKCNISMSGVDKRQTRCEECCKELIYPNWIITDMRFPNEMKAVKDREGITIRVVRGVMYHNDGMAHWWKSVDGEKAISMNASRHTKHDAYLFYLKEFYPNQHESETGLDAAITDYTIYNDGSIEDLVVQVEKVLTKAGII